MGVAGSRLYLVGRLIVGAALPLRPGRRLRLRDATTGDAVAPRICRRAMSGSITGGGVSEDDCQISLSEADGTAVVHVAGEIDLNVRAELVRMLAQACAGGRDVVVDVSRTTFMDSAGLHALVTAQRSQTAAGRSLVLRNPSASVRGILTMANLEEWFPIDSGPEA